METRIIAGLVELLPLPNGRCQVCGGREKGNMGRLTSYISPPAGNERSGEGTADEWKAVDAFQAHIQMRQRLGNFTPIAQKRICLQCALRICNDWTENPAGGTLVLMKIANAGPDAVGFAALMQESEPGKYGQTRRYLAFDAGKPNLARLIRLRADDPGVDEIEAITIKPDGTIE